MAVTRVWNLSDSGKEGVVAHNRMVLGQSLKPGQFVRVAEERLVGAVKVQADIDAGILHVGNRPPDWYFKMKKPPRAVADARRVDADGHMVGKKVAVAKGHERLPAEAMAEDVGEKIDEAAPEEAPAEEAVEAAPEPVEMPEATEEKTEEEPSGFGRRGKRSKRK